MRFARRFSVAISVMLLGSVLVGCPSIERAANDINRDIHSETGKIKDAAQSAQTKVAVADANVQAAATQPSNPPETVALLSKAHANLQGASKDLSTITPAANNIEAKSSQAVALTSKVQQKLDEERDHLVGYKGRVILWTLFGLSITAAIAAFIIRTIGLAPIAGAAGEIFGNVFGGLWKNTKSGARFLWHFFTLGAMPAADAVNKHYDQLEAKKKADAASAADQ